MEIFTRRPRRKWAVAAVIVLVLLLIGGGIWFFTGIRSDIGYGI